MHRRFIHVLFVSIFLFSCSSPDVQEEQVKPTETADENSIPEETVKDDKLIIDATVIKHVDGQEYQINVNSEQGITAISNLTEELGIDNLIVTDQLLLESYVGFYSWQLESYRVYQKDFSTGKVDFGEDYCALEEGGIRIEHVLGNTRFWTIVYDVYNQEQNQTRYIVTIYDKSNNTCQSVELPHVSTVGTTKYLVENDILAVYYLHDETGLPVVTLVDLSESKLLHSFYHDKEYHSSTLRQGEYICFQDGNVFNIYDYLSGEIIRTGNIPNWPYSHLGLFKTSFVGNRLKTKINHPDPTPITFSPIIYDLDAGSIVAGDDWFVFNIRDLDPQLSSVGYRAFDIDIESSTLVISYDNKNGSTGGLLFVGFNSEIYGIVPLDFIPDNVIIRKITWRSSTGS